MPRPGRASAGGLLYHASNTAAGRKRFFRDAVDYAAFIEALKSAKNAVGVKLLGYCLMPDHFHVVLLPRKDGDLSRFMLRLATAHVRHYRDRHHVRTGDKLYAARFRNFPIQSDVHLLDVLRYVESNPVRVGEVKRAGQWAWSSLKMHDGDETIVDPSPVPLGRDWEKSVAGLPPATLEEIRTCHRRGRPYGVETWTRRTASRLDIGSSLRPRGRPRKTPKPKVARIKPGKTKSGKTKSGKPKSGKPKSGKPKKS